MGEDNEADVHFSATCWGYLLGEDYCVSLSFTGVLVLTVEPKTST
jgi:hypothetical protein